MGEALIKKIQPHSAEAEQSVIGAMIMDRDAIADVIDIIDQEDFYQKIWYPSGMAELSTVSSAGT